MLGKRLRQTRTDHGYSLREVEHLTGIPFALLSKYELGIREPSRKRLEQLADFYGVTTDWLLGRTHIYTTEQVRDEVAHYGIPDNDPRVLEIARELREITNDPDILENILTYARFLAEQERRHPGPHKPGPVRIKNSLLSGRNQNPVKDGKNKQE